MSSWHNTAQVVKKRDQNLYALEVCILTIETTVILLTEAVSKIRILHFFLLSSFPFPSPPPSSFWVKLLKSTSPLPQVEALIPWWPTCVLQGNGLSCGYRRDERHSWDGLCVKVFDYCVTLRVDLNSLFLSSDEFIAEQTHLSCPRGNICQFYSWIALKKISSNFSIKISCKLNLCRLPEELEVY